MLITVSEEKFTDISNLIDPSKHSHVEFFNLYNQAMQQRIKLRKYATETKDELLDEMKKEDQDRKCSIF